jgi:hypothetical protein
MGVNFARSAPIVKGPGIIVPLLGPARGRHGYTALSSTLALSHMPGRGGVAFAQVFPKTPPPTWHSWAFLFVLEAPAKALPSIRRSTRFPWIQEFEGDIHGHLKSVRSHSLPMLARPWPRWRAFLLSAKAAFSPRCHPDRNSDAGLERSEGGRRADRLPSGENC